MKTFLLCLLLLSTSAFARQKVAPQDQKVLTEVLTKNDALFNAFLKKDAAKIEKEAKELAVLVEKSKSPLLKDVKANAKSLNQIKAAKKNEENLVSYEAFLNPLIKVVEANEAPKNFNVFSCPMVKKAWLQNIEVNKDVRNVYAMEMLECGTQDTKF
ncbi:MAG: DUF3347 domain-containing protein [Bdellovibrionales bacterium]|nr:DUF3347 domain-containing protein [Bdellovibrionales bacterium]